MSDSEMALSGEDKWNTHIKEQQAPKQDATGDDIWLKVMEDMEQRRQMGISKYGVPVMQDNGRDHLIDAYQEALDLCVYLRAEIEKRKLNEQAK